MDYQKELAAMMARNLITLERVKGREGATKIAKAMENLLETLVETIDFKGGLNNHQPGLFDMIQAFDKMGEGLENKRLTLLEDNKKETEEAE